MVPEPLAPADRDELHRALRQISPLGDDDLAAVEDCTRLRSLARSAVFLRAGDRAVSCGVLLSGLVRVYFLLGDGREVTRGFTRPGEPVGSLSDLLLDEPARSCVDAVTDARVAEMPWAHVRECAARMPAWTSLLARITEQLYLIKAAREYELLALDAEARYLVFRARYAGFEPKIPLRQVASYIGVTPEHLSRLRRRLAGPAAASR